MIPLNTPELHQLSRFLQKYDPESTIAQLSGLLTVPAFHANTIRIETLLHLAVAKCNGKKKAGPKEINNWLNRYLGKTRLASLEDPIEDVFISNVETNEGNRRVFEGIWQSNDYYLQAVLDCINDNSAPEECSALLPPIYALLQLSESVAERLNLVRWHSEPTNPGSVIRIAPIIQIAKRAKAITFTYEDLVRLNISPEVLSPFILTNADKLRILDEEIGHTSLEKKPIINYDNRFILALPHAVSPAIRRFVLTSLREIGLLPNFGIALSSFQADQVKRDGLWELRDHAESIEPPKPDGILPSLHSLLLKYDVNKYLLILLLHDHLGSLEEQGLSSIFQYSESHKTELTKYIMKVADHCNNYPDFEKGYVITVQCGLGRGFVLGFKEWPEQWRFASIRIPDLLMISYQSGGTINKFLKLIEQKEWATNKGIEFMSIDGDFAAYCNWENNNYLLVPRNIPIRNNSIISMLPDVFLPVRKEIRTNVDRHVIPTTSGHVTKVIRFGRDVYFRSMYQRPIYASIEHLTSGIYGGAIETNRGVTWLIITPREGEEIIQYLLYQMWSGFLGLFDRLVNTVEYNCENLATGALEIKLNFNALKIPDNYQPTTIPPSAFNIEQTVNLSDLIVEIIFPQEFLLCFQQPDNFGERSVVKSIVEGLICLHNNSNQLSENKLLDYMVNIVLDDPGMRVLHVFQSKYAIEHLQARENEDVIFLSQEDYIFSKLNLSAGCTSTQLNTEINTKELCNEFLHCIADKIWNQIKQSLKGLDRSSVICDALRVYEAAIYDRDHWQRTARAILALYERDEDVVKVARKRESDRATISMAARIIIEMAICECPASGGDPASQWEMEDLLAKATLLVEAGMDSDAINNDLLEPNIFLEMNGEYTIKRDFHETVIRPYLEGYFQEEFEGAITSYGRLYEKQELTERKRAEDVYDAHFIDAFKGEFHLSPDEALDCFAQLINLAVELDTNIVKTSYGFLLSKLQDNGISNDCAVAFLNLFGLVHRPHWEVPPTGFLLKDIYPWRFRRRLSATSRPIIIFGISDDDTVIYGAGSLRLSFEYLIERSERGHLPQDFFTSEDMRKYIGEVNQERGHEFTLHVGEKLNNQGWQVRTEVSMTEIGASAKLGDIDVLAWKQTGEILIVECKRLQLARTIAEISEICRRFRGEEKDELDKHVKRVKYLTEHPESIEKIVGFIPDINNMTDKLVTNTHVPMKYLDSLPIDSVKIGPIS